MPRKSQDTIVQRRTLVIQAVSSLRVTRAAMAKANGHRQPDVAQVEHRRVDLHVEVLQQRVEPAALGGRGRQRLEGARDERQEREEEDRRSPSAPPSPPASARGCGRG